MTLAAPYTYTATIVRVIDGDTIVAHVDLGFDLWLHDQSFRLAGCNAIERYEPGGREATAHLTALLPAGLTVLLSSVRNDKYGGRYDARILVPDVGDLTDYLCDQGWAVPYTGRGPLPQPAWPRPAIEPVQLRRGDFGLARGARDQDGGEPPWSVQSGC